MFSNYLLAIHESLIFCAYMHDVVFVLWNNDAAVDICGSFPLWRARSSGTSHVTMDQAADVSHSG